MKNKITLYDYLAWNQPAKSIALIQDFGYSFQNSNPTRAYLSLCLANLVNNEGENALTAMANIHPDRELIMGGKQLSFTGEQEQSSPVIEKKCNCDSTGSNCKGCSGNNNNNNLFATAILVSSLLLAVAIIAKS